MANNNASAEFLGKRHPHELRIWSVLVRSSKTSQNIHPGRSSGTSTAVSCGGAVASTPFGGFRITITESRVQPTTRTQEPFDADVNRPPLALEAVLVPLADRSEQVQLPTIAEVQPRIWHGGIVA